MNSPTATNLRARVNINAGGRMRDFRADAGQQGQAGAVHVVRQAMVNHRQNPRIAQQHFVDTARRRVAVVGGQYVGVEDAAQAR